MLKTCLFFFTFNLFLNQLVAIDKVNPYQIGRFKIVATGDKTFYFKLAVLDTATGQVWTSVNNSDSWKKMPPLYPNESFPEVYKENFPPLIEEE